MQTTKGWRVLHLTAEDHMALAVDVVTIMTTVDRILHRIANRVPAATIDAALFLGGRTTILQTCLEDHLLSLPWADLPESVRRDPFALYQPRDVPAASFGYPWTRKKRKNLPAVTQHTERKNP